MIVQIRKKRNISNVLIFHLKKSEIKEQKKHKVSRRKEIIKIFIK